MKKKHSLIIKHILVNIALSLGALVFLIPFFWMISTSLKGPGAVFSFPPEWIPSEFVWENFSHAWTVVPFSLFLRNTAFITIVTIIGAVFSSSLIAFGFARMQFRGRSLLFGILLASMMIPWEVTIIPLFVQFNFYGWIDTFYPLIVPSFFGSAFFVFLLRQYFLTIPLDLDEAATIDGCSPFKIYWKILLPIVKPALVTVAVFQMMGSWNDFMGPLIFLNSQHNFTLTLGLNLFRNSFHTEWHNMMAISSVITIVPLIVFFAAQKHLIGGIALSGLKS